MGLGKSYTGSLFLTADCLRSKRHAQGLVQGYLKGMEIVFTVS